MNKLNWLYLNIVLLSLHFTSCKNPVYNKEMVPSGPEVAELESAVEAAEIQPLSNIASDQIERIIVDNDHITGYAADSLRKPDKIDGKIKWFNAEKGYGFIIPYDGTRDVFVHWSNVEGLEANESLSEGEEVVFDIKNTPKGMSAVRVIRLSTH